MTKNSVPRPVLTMAAVAAVGAGLWWANLANTPPTPAATVVSAQPTQPQPTQPQPTQAQPTRAPGTAQRPAPLTAPAPTPRFAPAYAGAVDTAAGRITIDLTVAGTPTDTEAAMTPATGYVCDGAALESWLRGTASDGTLRLADQGGTTRIQGRLRGDDVVGRLWIGERSWDFTAAKTSGARR